MIQPGPRPARAGVQAGPPGRAVRRRELEIYVRRKSARPAAAGRPRAL